MRRAEAVPHRSRTISGPRALVVAYAKFANASLLQARSEVMGDKGGTCLTKPRLPDREHSIAHAS